MEEKLDTNSTSKSKEKLAIFLVLIATIIWGSQYIIIKEGISQIPPLLFQAIRHGIAFLGFIPVWGRLKNLNKITFVGALISAIVFFFLLTFLTYGLGFTTSNKGAFLASLYVVFTPFVGYLLLKTPLKKFQLAAVFVAMIGMGIMIFGNANSSDLELAPNIGDFLVLIAAIFNAFQIVLIEKYVKQVDIFLFVMAQMLMISVFMFGASTIIGEQFMPSSFTPSILWILFYIGIMATTVTLIIQTWAQKYIDATRAAILYALEPVFAILFGVMLGGEVITLAFLIGSSLMLIGILWSSIKKDSF
jgi:drug/metabolite transporter (DMT)-like permease